MPALPHVADPCVRPGPASAVASLIKCSDYPSRPVPLGDPHVQLQDSGQVLRIPSSHLGDEGRYQCVAFSPAGQQAKDFRLRVHCEPGPFLPPPQAALCTEGA